MRYLTWSLIFLVLPLVSNRASGQYYPPTDSGTWESINPTDLGWDQDATAELISWLEGENTKAFIVLKGGKIALEEYFGDFHPDSSWVWFSAGKSLMSVLVGMAQDEGLLDIEDPTSKYLGRWTLMTRAREDAVKIKHQLTMTTGLNDALTFACTLRACLLYSVDPGTRWAYHNAPYNLLRTVLEEASGQNITEFTRSRLGPTIGFDGFWEPSGFNSFFLSTARSAARFGLLMARDGNWESTAVLGDTDYVDSLTRSSQNMNPSYGRLWWLNGKQSYIAPGDSVSISGPISPNAPADVFLAAGSRGQFVVIAPNLDLVVVRMGEGSPSDLVPLQLHDELWRRLMKVLGTGTGTTDPPATHPFEWTVSPNPARGLVRITAIGNAVNNRGHAVVVLVDALGRRTSLKTSLSNGQGTIDVSSLAPGVYFAVIHHRVGHSVKPLVVH